MLDRNTKNAKDITNPRKDMCNLKILQNLDNEFYRKRKEKMNLQKICKK
jgi:hypothetical protein